MSNIISELAEGGAKGLFSGLGDLFTKTRQAIKGLELDPNKKAELDSQLASLELESEKLEQQANETTAKEKDSARNREIEIAKLGKKNYIMPILATLAIVGFGWVMVRLFNKDIDNDNRDLIMMLVGALIAQVKDIYGYYFGSSFGSHNKDLMRK